MCPMVVTSLADRNQFLEPNMINLEIPLILLSFTPLKLANSCFDSSLTMVTLLFVYEDQASSLGDIGDVSVIQL